MELRIYLSADGRAPVEEWLEALRDVTGRVSIRARMARV
jgi:putative component of toxin-antitoxin plasmid stabilization module